MLLASLLLLIGLIGSLGMLGFLNLFLSSSKNERKKESGKISFSGLEILIPVHNDSMKMRRTIESIQSELEKSRLLKSKSRIVVGLDHCTDSSREIAQSLGVTIKDSHKGPGKWRNLMSLIKSSTSEWLMLVDAGTELMPEFFTHLEPEIKSNYAAVAPGYRLKHENKSFFSLSTLKSLFWIFEKRLKNIENSNGGPVSVHGACCIYRREDLLQALEVLDSSSSYLNDDVVIPLLVRAFSRRSKIKYMGDSLFVFDSSIDSVNAEQRKKRILAGNLQWIVELYPMLWKKNRLIAILALRRVFRVFWAWWLVSLVIGSLLAIVQSSIPLTLILPLFMMLITSLFILSFIARELYAAFLVSLQAPSYLLNRNYSKVGWR